MRTAIICGVLMALSLDACVTAEQRKPAPAPTVDPLAAVQPLVDCEWKAAGRDDNGSYTVAELADHIIAVCGVERLKARRALHLPSNDPALDLDDFKAAVKTVEAVRKLKLRE